MSISRVFHPVLIQDTTLVPIKVFKKFVLQGQHLTNTSSGYYIWDAVHSNLITPIGSQKASNDPTNSFDGSFQHVVYKSLDQRFYRYPYNRMATLEHSNPRFTFKFLNYSASALSVPYLDMGESIKPGSVELTQSNYFLTDDQNGNLYDPSIQTGSFPDRNCLVAYWGFNDVFRKFKYREGYLENSTLEYQSNNFQPSRPSYVKNVNFKTGVTMNGTGSGMCAAFSGSNSYVLTEHLDDFNFDGDFSISFWVNPFNIGADQNIISKRHIVEKIEHQNNLPTSRSFKLEETNVYPFDFSYQISTEYFIFRRSNGIDTKTLILDDSNDFNNWKHFCFVKTGSNLITYNGGVFYETYTDVSGTCFNKHSLTFGLGLSGSLDEVRFYNKGLTHNEVRTLSTSSNQSLYQTAVVGNSFYRSGNIVISGFDPKYLNAFKNTWTLKYRGTHTIYQREFLIRIPKESFNLSQNPTALQSYKSDLLIPEMASGSLLPYFTEIGLYDDEGNLLVVAKPNQPIQLRDDTDLNVIIKLDI